ncbi:MAG: hypothetical protein OXC60_09685 [Litoreibacter sp.]|nr:hypothetical protein [Litoreibacter sp.]
MIKKKYTPTRPQNFPFISHLFRQTGRLRQQADDSFAQNPGSHPEIIAMTERQRADLPFPRFHLSDASGMDHENIAASCKDV